MSPLLAVRTTIVLTASGDNVENNTNSILQKMFENFANFAFFLIVAFMNNIKQITDASQQRRKWSRRTRNKL